jgi:cytochrome c
MLLQSADLDDARNYFIASCIGCHAFACNKSGPALGSLFGRKAGFTEGDDGHSEELKNYDVIWTEETLNTHLTDPGVIIKFVEMARLGKIKDKELRYQMIQYLKTEEPSINPCG